MSAVAISVRRVSKYYTDFSHHRAWSLPWRRSSDAASASSVRALHEVSFDVQRGQSVSIIGRNGGGKSTLLQIITGVTAPTTGEVVVNGRVSALLELGSGFNPEYSGRENVILGGMLLGLSRRDIVQRFDEIAAFAELGDAIDRPVKTYSSGMLMRLAFALQVLTDPEILIIDEALGVGDFFFQQKCFGYIRGLRERGTTLLFVSHDMGTVRDMCTHGLHLKRGLVDFFGDNQEAIRRYMSADSVGQISSATSTENTPRQYCIDVHACAKQALTLSDPLWSASMTASRETTARSGELLSIGLYTSDGTPTLHANIGHKVTFRVLYQAHQMAQLHLSVVLKNKYDQIVSAMGSNVLRTPLPTLTPGDMAIFELVVCLNLEAGQYSFAVRLSPLTEIGRSLALIDESPWLGPLEVRWDYHREIPPFYGLVGLPATARFVTRLGDQGAEKNDG
jgi:lipopolysaccharide transport system ATP-binding protein